MSGNEVIFRKESQIEERELRLLTEVKILLIQFGFVPCHLAFSGTCLSTGF